MLNTLDLDLDLDLFKEVHIDLPLYEEAEAWLHGAKPSYTYDVRSLDLDAEELNIYYFTSPRGEEVTVISTSGARHNPEPIILFGKAPLGYILAERLISGHGEWQPPAPAEIIFKPSDPRAVKLDDNTVLELETALSVLKTVDGFARGSVIFAVTGDAKSIIILNDVGVRHVLWDPPNSGNLVLLREDEL